MNFNTYVCVGEVIGKEMKDRERMKRLKFDEINQIAWIEW